MKKLLITALITSGLMASVSSFAAQGNSSGGGGNAIVTQSGEVVLLDLATQEMIEHAKNKKSFDKFFPSVVMKLGEESQDFFSCSSNTFKKFETYEALTLLENIKKEVNPVFVNFRLAALSNTEELKIPYGNESSVSADQVKQEIVASYVKGRLWIAKPIYSKMNKKSQCALQVHEALRHLNYLQQTEILSTKQIEKLTRYFMGDSSENEVSQELSILSKIKKNEIKSTDYFEMANRFFEESDFYSKIAQDLTGRYSREERAEAYEKQSFALREGYEAQRKALSLLNEETRTLRDDLDIDAQIIESVITHKKGPWSAKNFKRLF